MAGARLCAAIVSCRPPPRQTIPSSPQSEEKEGGVASFLRPFYTPPPGGHFLWAGHSPSQHSSLGVRTPVSQAQEGSSPPPPRKARPVWGVPGCPGGRCSATRGRQSPVLTAQSVLSPVTSSSAPCQPRTPSRPVPPPAVTVQGALLPDLLPSFSLSSSRRASHFLFPISYPSEVLGWFSFLPSFELMNASHPCALCPSCQELSVSALCSRSTHEEIRGHRAFCKEPRGEIRFWHPHQSGSKASNPTHSSLCPFGNGLPSACCENRAQHAPCPP